MNFAEMATDNFWIWACISIAACLAGFYFAFRNLSRARIIEDTPTAKVRSAHQGYVELAGNAQLMDGPPISAPLTNSECCWYRYEIEVQSGKDNWKTLEQETSDSLFLLRDETGECIIDPEGATVCPTDQSIWYGYSREPADRNPKRVRMDTGSGLKMHSSFIRGRYRYTEERIYPGDSLYAIGTFKTLDDMDHHQSRHELTGALLREWKQDKASLLERFDTDKDGQIDVAEWDLAREAAAAQAQQEHQEQLQNQVLHTMSKTASRRHPYMLSSLPQFNLVRRYRLLATGSIAAFFVAGSLATWMIAGRFMG